ncbi:ribose 5-phosphate isomerase B [Porphyromonas sp. COT-239 OH1446]|uniref:ribose 5-phosphate isomerase B n=1 Tax=Porphyromonas sp. COT-239 OH1446 TaxID=1515613 RepID=UPI00052E3108|nr:ribose 5-phosphate isomerase B [Porphyromonas sp. COT-239 OH1446]KGN71397.1 ribose 5-phosphate isomerase [Porphyromonas sp. COT-239 OH1446]
MKTNKPIGLCSDHAGYETKELVKAYLEGKGIALHDYGCYSDERCDYPDFAHGLGRAIDVGEVDYGIAVCGSGNGISMALNKHASVRAALCWCAEIAGLARAHNDANVLSIPGRFVDEELCRSIVEAFLSSEFEGGRHAGRVAKIPL